MQQPDYVFSSESVTAGHPDKLCDQISDAVVDRYLRQDARARVVAECAVSTGILFLSIKAQSDAAVDAPSAAREVLRDVGYYGSDGGFDARTCTIMTSMVEQPAQPTPALEDELDDDEVERTTARDQATVFGFACGDTPIGMPLPIWLAHRLARRLAAARDELPYLSPDGKVQVAVEYKDHVARRVHGLTLVACQRDRDTPSPRQLEDDLRSRVLGPAFEGLPVAPDARTRVAINPDGPVHPGGPTLHAGLTGRKTAVDGYGEYGRQGAAALSGKDPSRIDRVGAYAARHAARNIVAAGLAQRCEVQLSYSIGLSRPVSVFAHTFGTGTLDDAKLSARVAELFDFRPAAIVRRFRLRRLTAEHEGAFYRRLAAYGQIGREDLSLPWDLTDHADALRGA